MTYAYWKAALAGDKPKMFVDSPEWGFYRCGVYEKQSNKARKRVGWTPVAIFANDDQLIAMVNGRMETDRDKINELWSYVANQPISEETYRAVAERGEPWPDSHETVQSIPVANSSTSIDEIKTYDAEIKAGGAFIAADIEIKIDDAAKQLAAFATIESDEQSSKARSLQQRFLDLRSEAAKAYEEANRPLLEEQKRIRGIWFPIRDKADEASNKLRSAMGVWEDTKRKAAKVAAERAAAGHEVKSNVPPPAAQIKGGTGRAAAVKVEKFVTSIDAEKVFAQFKDDERVIAFLTDLAQKAIRAGITVQGVTVEEKSVVR